MFRSSEPARAEKLRPARSRSARPTTVAFVDTGRWESFHQVAGLLRAAGCRCVRVTSEPSRLKRTLSRLLFQEVTHLPGDELGDWLASDDAAAVTDLLLTDEAFAAAARHRSGGLTTPAMPSAASPDALVLSRHKLRQAELFAERGIPQPDFLPADTTPPDVAVEQLGLPVVVKAALGYGGYGVRVAHTAAEVATALSALRADPSAEVFFQRFIEGPEYCYGCIATHGAPVQEVMYRRTSAVARNFGQSTSSETADDPALRELGRSIVAALGLSGFVNLGAIRSDDGALHVIDVNPRPWGGFASFLDLGVDLGQGYLHAIGGRPRPAAASALPAGRPFRSFPFWDEGRLVDDGVTLANVRSYLRAAAEYRRSIGTRYWLETMAFTALHVARRRPAVRNRPAR